jgi:hypothetical protein
VLDASAEIPPWSVFGAMEIFRVSRQQFSLWTELGANGETITRDKLSEKNSGRLSILRPLIRLIVERRDN